MTGPRVALSRIEAAIRTLADLAAGDHDEINGRVRGEIGHVLHALDRIAERRRP